MNKKQNPLLKEIRKINPLPTISYLIVYFSAIFIIYSLTPLGSVLVILYLLIIARISSINNIDLYGKFREIWLQKESDFHLFVIMSFIAVDTLIFGGGIKKIKYPGEIFKQLLKYFKEN